MSASILVTAKVNPDLDGVACAYAYSRLLNMQGKKATEGIFGRMHAEASYLVDRFGINDVAHDVADTFDSFILVDASDMAGMPSLIRRDAVAEVIDHREVNRASELFPNAKIQIEMVGSAATLIAEKYRSSQHAIDAHSCILLFGAIYSNTLNFQASIATDRDKMAADWLRSQAAIPESLVDDMFDAKTRFASQNLGIALENDSKQFTFGGCRIGIAQLEITNLQNLVETRLDDIHAELGRMKNKHQLDAALLTGIDLKEGCNIFVTKDVIMQSALASVFQIDFEKGMSKKNGALLRKQLAPLLKRAMEK